jgi:hypothetical protein
MDKIGRKPTWSEAPPWAQYLAQEIDGSWWWFEKEPKYDEKVQIWSKYGGRCVEHRVIKMKEAIRSLEQRQNND